jgi:tRNA G18 (ribose-2'-O)-methylase SpoU
MYLQLGLKAIVVLLPPLFKNDFPNKQTMATPSNMECASKAINVHNIYKTLGFTDKKLRELSLKMTNPYSLMIYNCHGDFNIGALCRTASCFSAKKIFTVGRRKFDRRTLVGAHHYTPVIRLDSIEDPVTWFDDQEMYPVFIEQGGTDISDFNFTNLWNEFSPCLVVGSECDGVPEVFMELFPDSPRISIAQSGLIRSLNVATAGAVALEHIYYAHRNNVIDKYGLI